MARTLAKAKGRKEVGNFLRVPTAVLDSPNFCALTTKAKALILDIGARYNGYNNGDLAAPWSWMRQRGWRSKGTLGCALIELRCRGMIELTRQGGLHGPSLYAFTWLPIDQCKARLDVPATSIPSSKWKQPPQPMAARAKKQNATPTIGADRPDHRGRGGENIATPPRPSGP